MSNRLDIELTSIRSDGSYTWRAAGARQPKGVIDAKILADSAKVGDVLRVEAEVEIDGITILGVLPPKEKVTPTGRIELIGSSKPVAAVTTVLLSEGGRGDRRDLLDSPRRGDRASSRDRRPARGAERPDGRRPQAAAGSSEAGTEARPPRRPRPEGASPDRSPRSVDGRPGSVSDRRPERRPRSPGELGAPSRSGEGRPSAPVGDRRPERRPRPEGQAAAAPSRSGEGRPSVPGAERRPSTRRPGTPPGERGLADGKPPAARSAPQAATRRVVPRFEPGTAHRDLLFASLASEQRPIAERLAAGGIPAVRRAIAAEQERARSEGRPEVTGEAILTLAEQLAPSVKHAIWRDRAEAAVAQLEQISLRDLRTTVAAAAPRDEASRDLDRKLREELERRITKLRTNWEEQITHALEEGRVLQALRFSAQPPEPTARFPAALVGRLATSAGAAMSSSTPVERWLAVLEAAVSSPIRRQIHPEGLPADASGEVVRKARVAAGSIPALAPMLGLSMPPPPKPLRTARPVRPSRPPRDAARPPRRAVSPGGTPRTEEPTSDVNPEVPEEPASPVALEQPQTAQAPAPLEDMAPDGPEQAEAAANEALVAEAPPEASEGPQDALTELFEDPSAATVALEPTGDTPSESFPDVSVSTDDSPSQDEAQAGDEAQVPPPAATASPA